MKIAQWLIVAALISNLLILIYRDINGREAAEPKGFAGVLGSLIATAGAFALYYFAGAFSEIFK